MSTRNSRSTKPTTAGTPASKSRKGKATAPFGRSRAKYASARTTLMAEATPSAGANECVTPIALAPSQPDAPLHLPSAPEILVAAADTIEAKAAARDKPSGERSMTRTVAAFGALTGHRLSESEGWLFLAAVKLARATAGSHEADDYTDLAAYAGLAGEAAARAVAAPAS